jgi:GNAT superfamily N-acetyltransferase
MMVESERITFRAYQASDYEPVAALWARINRELAPPGMEEVFERYIAATIEGELKQLLEIFSEAKRNAFWVVEATNGIVELRRMYLDRGHRGLGIAQRMLEHAQARARTLGFTRMILSTAEIQEAAHRFYCKSGFEQVRVEIAKTMTTKQVGAGLTRFHFEKRL